MRRLLEEYPASKRHVCGLIEAPRSSCRYHSRRDDSGLSERLLELAREQPPQGDPDGLRFAPALTGLHPCPKIIHQEGEVRKEIRL